MTQEIIFYKFKKINKEINKNLSLFNIKQLKSGNYMFNLKKLFLYIFYRI